MYSEHTQKNSIWQIICGDKFFFFEPDCFGRSVVRSSIENWHTVFIIMLFHVTLTNLELLVSKNCDGIQSHQIIFSGHKLAFDAFERKRVKKKST